MTTMVFFNVGWMNAYRGLSHGDSIIGGGSWPQQHGVGHEMYNFAPHRGRLYGSVQPPGGRRIHIERLGAGQDDPFIDDVHVVWVSRRPGDRLVVIGWYKHARVFREWQRCGKGAVRPVRSTSDQALYLATAPVAQCTLLEDEQRTLVVPRNTKGAMGQSNVWFADSALGRKFVAKVKKVMADPSLPSDRLKRRRGVHDQARKVRVEQAAIDLTWAYYESNGYKLRDVQKDNVGWDLEATRGREKLLLEVKGLSGGELTVELTPNEYSQMNASAHRKRYRLCVVTHALEDRRRELRRFALQGGRGESRWVDQHDALLTMEERVGARFSLR